VVINNSNDEARSAMTRLALLKLVMFQIVWLSCAIGAGQGRSWPGMFAAALLVALHLASTPRWRPAVMTVLAAGALGFLAETLLVGVGLVRYSAPWPTEMLAPAWIVALWLAFSSMLETTRRLLGPHPLIKSTLLGLLLGPLSYIAGERLGALAFSQSPWPGYLAVAVLWAIAYPGLLAIEGRLAQANRSQPSQH
jgi:hypothetical protein